MRTQKLKRKGLKLLNNIEIEELYALPQFTDQERIYYFTLNPAEENVLNDLTHIHSKVHFILQLGYFKSKYRLFKFRLEEILPDVQYIIARYFQSDETSIAIPSSKILAANNKRVLSLMSYQDSTTIATETLRERTQYLVRCLSKPIIIVRELIIYFKQKRIVFPVYSTAQDVIGNVMVTETKRLQSVVAKNVPPWVIKLLDALLSAEDISETITTFKKHPKNFNFKQIQLEIDKHKT